MSLKQLIFKKLEGIPDKYEERLVPIYEAVDALLEDLELNSDEELKERLKEANDDSKFVPFDEVKNL